MQNEDTFRTAILRTVEVLACACVVTQLALAQPWNIANVQKLLTVNASAMPGAALSPAGEVYVVSGASQTNSISKLDSTGKTLFTTTLAGVYEAGLAFDAAANVHVTGTATTSGFTTTAGAYRSTAPGDHAAFVCKLSPANGAVQYCTYLDATGDGFVAVDGSGSVAIVFGPASSALTTSGALNLGKNIHVEKLNPGGTGLIYAASFGGSSTDYPQGTVADTAGSLWITGKTYSTDFPTTPNGAVISNPSGPTGFTSFTVELNSNGSAFLFSTLGNSGEQGVAIALDPFGDAQVLEQDANSDLFLRRYKRDGSGILFETPLNTGNSAAIVVAPAMAVDTTGVTTVVGITDSVALPAYNAVQTCQFTLAPAGYPNGFLIRVDGSGNLLQSTWLQGPEPLELPVLSVAASTAFELVWSFTDLSQGANELDLITLAPQTTVTPVNLACIGNSASLTGAALAPGEIVSLFGNGIGPITPGVAQLGSNGRFPTSISNTTVTFDGVAAPLLYVSSSQINAVAPFGLAPNTKTQVCVTYEGTVTNCIAAGVAAAAPGVFMNPATPNYAVALNQNGTVNSPQNPLPAGSIITLFATGLGHVTPTPSDGSLIPVPIATQDLKVQVQVPNPDSHSPEPYFTTIQYAGPAPLEIAGLSQINVQIPGFMVEYTGPLTVWVTLPDGTVLKAPPVYVWISF